MHRLYETQDLTVFWDSDKCRHAKECVTRCPEAFDIQRKPWIQLDKAETAKVWNAVSQCPSGALTCVFNHDITIRLEKNRSVAYDGDSIIGECDFAVTNTGWDIYHTEVNEHYRGKSIAKRLVYEVVQAAEHDKANVILTCSYAKKVMNGS